MNENAKFLLNKAEQSIGAAESLLRDGYRDFAVGRVYYAMFDTAEALLAEDLPGRLHDGVDRRLGARLPRRSPSLARAHARDDSETCRAPEPTP